MNYFLSTKYKLGRVKVEENKIVDGGLLFRDLEGKNISEVIQLYKGRLTKTELKEKRNFPRFTPIEEVDDGDKAVTEGSRDSEARSTEASEKV